MVEEVDKQLDQECEVTYEVTGEKVDSIEYNAGAGTRPTPSSRR
ncbi:hypothetical protein [Streptomyces hirsutus]